MDARRSLRKAYAIGTFDNLNIQWVKYLHFCTYFSIKAFPATTLVLVWYAQFLSRQFKAHASIVGYLSGVKTLHTLLSFSTAGFNGFLLKLTLRGLRRENMNVVKRATPITPAILRALHTTIDFSDPIEVIFWNICILAFLLLFRKSNLVPNTINGFDSFRHLTHGDCVIDHELERVTVGIRWSKNHQFTKELLTFPLPQLQGSVLCPIEAITKLREMIPGRDQDHMFQLPNGEGSFTYRRFQSTLRSKLELLGFNANEFSSHSFRQRVTTFAFLCGIPTEMIKLLGNWKSDAFMVYLEFPIETRTAACELIKQRLLAMESRAAALMKA